MIFHVLEHAQEWSNLPVLGGQTLVYAGPLSPAVYKQYARPLSNLGSSNVRLGVT